MENKDLNNKVLRNVRNKIVISNLEREENMRLNVKKQVLSLCAASIIVLTGGFITVNAATEGKLVDGIKEIIKVNNIKEDGSSEELEETTYTESNGETWVKYETNSTNASSSIDINKTYLEKENATADININEKENEVNMIINGK